MANERLAPDAILDVSVTLSGTVADIQDDPDSPDANWLIAPSTDTNTFVRVSFPTPSGSMSTATDVQEFRALVRPNTAGSRNPTARIELWQNGVNLVIFSPDVEITAPTVLSLPWGTDNLSTNDATTVECRVVGTANTGGGPSSDKPSVEVGAVEWNAETGTVYVLKDDLSDLSFGDTSRVLSEDTEAAGSIDFSVSSPGFFTISGFTAAGNPGDDGTTGDFTVEVNLLDGSSQVDLSVTLTRVDQTGTAQTSSATQGPQDGTVGLHTFTFTGVDLGTWASGDRLRVEYEFQNLSLGPIPLSVETGTTDTETVAPWTLGAGGVDVLGAASLSGNASLSVTSRVDVTGSATLAADGSLSTAAEVDVTGGAQLSGEGALSAAARVDVTGGAQLSGEGDLAAAALLNAAVGVYVLKDDLSDLTFGDDSRVLSVGTEPAGSVTATIDALGGFFFLNGFTVAGEPGATGTTGNYSVEVNVLQGNNNVNLRIDLSRVDATGAVQASGQISLAQTASAGLHTFTFNNVSLGTWVSGDRLRVQYEFENTGLVQASVDIETGTLDTETVTPWATAGVDVLGAASLSGDASLAARSRQEIPATSVLAGDAELTAVPRLDIGGAAALAGEGVLAATSRVDVVAVVALAGEGLLAVTAVAGAPATLAAVELSGTATVTASGRVEVSARADLVGVGSVAVLARLVVFAVADVSSGALLATVARLDVFGVASVSASGVLAADGGVPPPVVPGAVSPIFVALPAAAPVAVDGVTVLPVHVVGPELAAVAASSETTISPVPADGATITGG